MCPTARRAVLSSPFALLACLLVGCASNRGTSDFMTTINAIRPDTPMNAVRERLGQPNKTYEGAMPAIPAPGPLEALTGKLTPGTHYRQWVYERGDSHFHVFFARTLVQSDDAWEVVLVRSVPAKAVN